MYLFIFFIITEPPLTYRLPTYHSRRRTIFAVGERVYSPYVVSRLSMYILRACDIIVLIHFRCILASKHKSGRPSKSYGTMLTVASSPWTEYTEYSITYILYHRDIKRFAHGTSHNFQFIKRIIIENIIIAFYFFEYDTSRENQFVSYV